ncbi:MAG: hypothetical protein IKJ45_15900 [Kiritimatiellae bacterium]|nr:hypothetical protein [Kiritimatiellia bacterium]
MANAGTATLLSSADGRGDSFYATTGWNPAVAPNNRDVLVVRSVWAALP